MTTNQHHSTARSASTDNLADASREDLLKLIERQQAQFNATLDQAMCEAYEQGVLDERNGRLRP